MSKRKLINVDELKKVFRLKDGKLERLNPKFKGGKWAVVVNKGNNGRGYCTVRFNGRMVYYHTIVWILSTNKDVPQAMDIDHINGNKIDNRFENLRLVTQRENQQNGKVHRNGKLFGCTFDKSKGKYLANIQISGKLIYLGRYGTEQEAHEAYKVACVHTKDYVDNASFREMIKKEVNK